MKEFEKELKSIQNMLHSIDTEIRFLGYNLLRTSEFKKFMRGKIWSENNMSFYRFNLYAINNKFTKDPNKQIYRNYHNSSKINFAYKVITLYLENKLIIKKL